MRPPGGSISIGIGANPVGWWLNVLGNTRAGVYTSTILMAVLLLGEPFTVWEAAGTVLVLAGIWLLVWQPASKPAL